MLREKKPNTHKHSCILHAPMIDLETPEKKCSREFTLTLELDLILWSVYAII